MKRGVLILFLLMLLPACFAGNGEEPYLFDEEQELEEAELRVLLLNTNENYMLKYRDAFREKYPQIKINIVQQRYPQSISLELDLEALIEEHNPDIVEIHPFYMHHFKDLFVDLGQYVQFEHIDLEDFYPALIEAASLEGELKGIPYKYAIPLFFYERQAFDQAGLSYPEMGWTWEEAIETLKQLEQPNLVMTIAEVESFMLAQGKSLLSTADFSAMGYLNDPSFVEDVAAIYTALKDDVSFQELGLDGLAGGITIGSSLGFSADMRESQFETGLVAAVGVPHFVERQRVSSMSMSSLAILKGSEQQEAAWQFLKESLIENNEVSQQLARDRYFSTRASVSRASGFDQLEVGRVILDELHYAQQSIATLGPTFHYNNLVNSLNNEYVLLDFDNLEKQLDEMADTWDRRLRDFLHERK